MSRRSSSLNQIDSGLSREIGSKFDVVKKVADNLALIESVGGSELVTLTKPELEALAAMTGVDVVAGVAQYIPTIAESDLVTLTAQQWLDLFDITDAAQLIQNLQAVATTLEAGEEVTVDLTGSTLTFGIPKGVDGVNGTVGLTPEITLSIDENMNLVYDVVYVESVVATVEEW